MMHSARLLKRILRGDDAKFVISTLLAWQQCKGTGVEKAALHVNVCEYVGNENMCM